VQNWYKALKFPSDLPGSEEKKQRLMNKKKQAKE
jgi:hypothetical protein